MIGCRKKSLKDILEVLASYSSIFIAGCSDCATICQAGGEDEVKEMEEELKRGGKVISGAIVFQTPCHSLLAKRDLRRNRKAIEEADCILALVCGAGVQSLAEISEKPVIAGLESLFLGRVEHIGTLEERCSLCGECVLDRTASLCVRTGCPKGMMNGPCGGMVEGKCEVDRDKDCIWVSIYNKLLKLGKLDKMMEIAPARDHSRSTKPAKLQGKGKK